MEKKKKKRGCPVKFPLNQSIDPKYPKNQRARSLPSLSGSWHQFLYKTIPCCRLPGDSTGEEGIAKVDEVWYVYLRLFKGVPEMGIPQ
jgi:hypothetical protein